MNPFLCGHIVFTTVTGLGAIPELAGRYNTTVQHLIVDGEAVPGCYIVAVGAALAPPSDPDAAISISTSLNGALWSNATVTDIGLDASSNRLFQICVVQAAPGPVPAAGTVIPNVEDVMVRFTVKRVEPRTSR